jgi:PAS domain S-box-containing protein
MTPMGLKRRVEARDRLVLQAENVEALLQQQVLGALARGDLGQAEAAATHNETQLRALTENLRIYQAELHAQADELAAAQERSEQMLTRFAALFASLPVATLLVGFNGEMVEHNGKAATLFGFRRRGSVVRFLHRMVEVGGYQDRVRPAFHEARDSGASAIDNVEFIAEDGRRFVGEMHIARLPAVADKEPQFTCAVIDRTEHIEDLRALQSSAEALRQNEAFLGDSARLARIGGWELLLHPRALRWSKELRQLFEVGDDDEATLEATLARCSPHDRAVFATAVARAELGEPFEIELDMSSARGRRMRVLAVGHAEGLGGGVNRVSGVFQDITVQAEARHQIDDLTERLSLANDASGIGIWDWNQGSGELVFDARLCQLLALPTPGLTLQAAPGDLAERLGAHLHPDDAQILAAAVARALQRQEPLNQELRRSRPGGARDGDRWLHVTGRAHFDAAGQPSRFVGCAWDSSPEHEAARLRAAKDSAESASRAKSAFLSRMSHELRTPLNAILGFSQLMRMEAEAGDLVLKPHRVTLIETAARHLLDLVNEVLDVTRIESGHVDVRLTTFPLHEVVAEALPMVQGLADAGGVTLRDGVAAQPGLQVLGDRLRLKEVLINLLSNAVKYNLRGGSVDVAAALHEGGLELSVADTGQGLDAQQLAGMFQPFNRLGAEASGVQGTGMGLFVSRRFVELMGGSIAVSSQPGVGTTFRVRLNVPAD